MHRSFDATDGRAEGAVGRPAQVLVVDDDDGTRELVALALERRGHRVLGVSSAEAALQELRRADFDAVVTDLEMPPGEGGLALAQRVGDGPSIPVIVLTGKGDLNRAISAIQAGVYDFLRKPVSPEVLAVSVERALRHRELSDEVVRLRAAHAASTGFAELVGDSRPTRDLQDLMVRVAPAHVPVLVTGERGTGKEEVARALHRRSPRASGPFVTVSCEAMQASLLELELFGRAPSAGAAPGEERHGLLTRAAGGTLFIDAVDAMPLDVQAKLLRVLEEQSMRPVGSEDEQNVDVRVVACTHRDLEEAVDEGSFREELYYRLSVVHLAVPPLRARGRDVLHLARAVIERASHSVPSRAVRGIAPSAARKLLAYDWPGNVRELENCVEHACTLTRFEEITAEDLPDKVRDYKPGRSDAAVNAGDLPSMEQVEREHMRRVLDAVGGNKTKAAKVLGFDRRTLYRKAERYGMEI